MGMELAEGRMEKALVTTKAKNILKSGVFENEFETLKLTDEDVAIMDETVDDYCAELVHEDLKGFYTPKEDLSIC